MAIPALAALTESVLGYARAGNLWLLLGITLLMLIVETTLKIGIFDPKLVVISLRARISGLDGQILGG